MLNLRDILLLLLFESVLATHLSQILNKFAGQLIGQDDVQVLLNNLSKTAPNLVESVVPKLVPLHNLTGILLESFFRKSSS